MPLQLREHSWYYGRMCASEDPQGLLRSSKVRYYTPITLLHMLSVRLIRVRGPSGSDARGLTWETEQAQDVAQDAKPRVAPPVITTQEVQHLRPLSRHGRSRWQVVAVYLPPYTAAFFSTTKQLAISTTDRKLARPT